MSTKDVHAGPPRAQNFHPEFGYFCPSKQLRHKVRSGARTAGAVILIVVGTALALVPQLAPQSRDGTREESAFTAAAPSPTAKSAGLVEGVDLGKAGESMPAPMARAAALPVGAHTPAACNDPSGAFLAPQCRLGKTGRTGKSRGTRTARVPGARVATFRIGRADAGLEAQPENVAAARPWAVAGAATTAFAMKEPPPSPRERPAAPAKKPVRIAQKQTPRRDVAGPDTAASAPSPGFDLFGRFHEPPRSTGGAWAMSWPPRPSTP
jgi:hypothetical protein